MNNFLKLNDENNSNINIYDDVEIIVDPELKDISTVDINNYIDKFILQCRICGNIFPSDNILQNNSKCPICGDTSNNGFIYKGKLKKKQKEDLLNNDTDKIFTVDESDNKHK